MRELVGGRRLGDNRKGDGLIILDQHGARERILYERLRENPEAAPATLERPATAILPEDLARVESLGSRGNALHPIGSVYHLTLRTKNAPGAGSPGFRVRVLAGETVDAGPASHPPGTAVEARELFLNLPVRRGFLGTVRAEANAGYDNGPLRPGLGLRAAARAPRRRGARSRASTP
jgi:DNA mismatch repair ATPase MutL